MQENFRQTSVDSGKDTRHALLRLVEACKKCLNNNDVVGMVLTELSRAYDCLHYGLLVAKLHAYGFSLSSFRMIYSYLTSRKQCVQINSNIAAGSMLNQECHKDLY